jgi:hypothetical protein
MVNNLTIIILNQERIENSTLQNISCFGPNSGNAELLKPSLDSFDMKLSFLGFSQDIEYDSIIIPVFLIQVLEIAAIEA